MRCPYCGEEETQVKDSRPSDDGSAIRRRRSCPSCGARFTTFERIQLRELAVVKSDGRRQPLDREKIMRSMQVALRKRPVSAEQVDRTVSGIIRQLESRGEAEVSASEIGALVMKALAVLDIVGYIRYASVYKDFCQPEDFNAFVEDIEALRIDNSKADTKKI